MRKKKTLEIIESLDGSLYKHFVTRDPQSSTSSTATSMPMYTNPSRESIVDAHAGPADQSSLVCSGGLYAGQIMLMLTWNQVQIGPFTLRRSNLAHHLLRLRILHTEEFEMSPDDMVIAAEGKC